GRAITKIGQRVVQNDPAHPRNFRRVVSEHHKLGFHLLHWIDEVHGYAISLTDKNPDELVDVVTKLQHCPGLTVSSTGLAATGTGVGATMLARYGLRPAAPGVVSGV